MTLARPLALTAALALAGCSASLPMAPAAGAPSLPPTVTAPGPTAPATAADYAATITPQELAGLLYTYADDYMAGRDTGAPGQRFAATFLAGQYAAMGIAPKGRGTAGVTYGLAPYLQPFDLERRSVRAMTFTVTRGAAEVLRVALPSDGLVSLVPAYGSVAPATDVPVVYVGDGSALEGLDVAGAFAIGSAADRGAVRRLSSALAERGALAAIVAAAPSASVFQGMAADAVGEGRLSMTGENGADYALILTGTDVVETLLGGPMAGAKMGDTGLRMTTTVDASTDRVGTENVIAFVEGSDPVLKDEFVVVSAHLDHVGDDGEGPDVIYNGADDDGSGTVTVLEIAEAFQAAKNAGDGPRRSILFLHVTGEEKGLFGSEYYADRDPVVPLANTVANLNIDMIGRYDPERGFDSTDYVYIIGGDLISQDISDWNEAANEAMGTGLLLSDRFNSPDDPNQFFRRSDHWNFGKHDIPFIFYFTGTHEDYHGVGDEPHKIDYDRMARIGQLIFGTAWDIANRDERPAVSGVGFN